MTTGLRVRAGVGDPNAGQIILEVTDSLTRFLGTVSTSTAAGSITDSRLTTGRPFFYVRGALFGSQGKRVTFSGSTMSWTTSNFSADIEYGVF